MARTPKKLPEPESDHPLDQALARVAHRVKVLAEQSPPVWHMGGQDTRTPDRERWMRWAFSLPIDVLAIIAEAHGFIEKGRAEMAKEKAAAAKPQAKEITIEVTTETRELPVVGYVTHKTRELPIPPRQTGSTLGHTPTLPPHLQGRKKS
jgi:hypothetical protein